MNYSYSFLNGRLIEKEITPTIIHQCDHSLEYLKTIQKEPILKENPQFVVSRMIKHLEKNYPELLL
jgi:hypothetical protein